MVGLLTALSAIAALPGPIAVVREANAAIQKELRGANVSSERLANTVEGYVDFAELSRRALGKAWEGLSPAQRSEFSATMKGLLRASYARKAIGQGTADITYGEETVDGSEEATVRTVVRVKKDAIPVDYKLFKAAPGGAWRVYDVVTDEVSLLETYRDQFRKLIADKGFAGLLSTLKAKREQLEKG